MALRGDAASAVKAASKVTGVRRVGQQAAPGGGASLSIELAKNADAGRVTEEIVAALVAAGAGVREVGPA